MKRLRSLSRAFPSSTLDEPSALPMHRDQPVMLMKTIAKRLERLETVAASVDHGPTAAEMVLASRRRRGVPDKPRLPVDYTGCRTIADVMLRARRARMGHEPRQRHGNNG